MYFVSIVYSLFENCGDADLIDSLLLLEGSRRGLAIRETLRSLAIQ